MLMLNRFTLLVLVCHEAAAFEENDDARDVVNRVLFSLPGCHWLFDYDTASAFKVISVPERHDQVNYLVVGKEFPDAIRGKNHELIIVVYEKLLDLCTNTKTL